MHIGPKGIALIQSFESLQHKAYVDTHEKDGTPRYANGWGHTRSMGPPEVHQGDVWTDDFANDVFKKDMILVENKVNHYVNVPLNQNQFDALVSAAYNMSTAHFVDMIKDSGLNKGNYAGVATALMKYNMSQGRVLRGLTRRRFEEGALFNTPV